MKKLFAYLLSLGLTIGTVYGLVYLSGNYPKHKYKVCYLSPEMETVCIETEQSGYTMNQGCATFNTGSSICHILGVFRLD